MVIYIYIYKHTCMCACLLALDESQTWPAEGQAAEAVTLQTPAPQAACEDAGGSGLKNNFQRSACWFKLDTRVAVLVCSSGLRAGFRY